VSNASGEPTVLLLTADLFFKAKLDGIARGAGASVVSSPPADVAVVELGRPDAVERIRAFVDEGLRVLAFGSHVRAEDLRAARDLGATAVPNSGVEAALRDLLAEAAG
jgi:hypothetical protein